MRCLESEKYCEIDHTLGPVTFPCRPDDERSAGFDPPLRRGSVLRSEFAVTQKVQTPASPFMSQSQALRVRRQPNQLDCCFLLLSFQCQSAHEGWIYCCLGTNGRGQLLEQTHTHTPPWRLRALWQTALLLKPGNVRVDSFVFFYGIDVRKVCKTYFKKPVWQDVVGRQLLLSPHLDQTQA